MTTLYIVLLLVLLAFSAFFSATEAALLSLRQVALQRMAQRSIRAARLLARVAEHPEQHVLPTILLGNNLVNIALASIATSLVLGVFAGPTGIVVATAGTTITILLFGEMVPKAVSVRHAETVSRIVIYPLLWTEKLLWPGVAVLKAVGHIALRLFGGAQARPVATEEEVRMMVSVGRAEGTVVQREGQLVENVFRAGDKKARDVMTPRIEVNWIHRGMLAQEFLALYHRNQEGRFPVYQDGVDNIVGVLVSRDVLMALASGEIRRDTPVTGLALPPFFTPETKPLLELLDEMRSAGAQMAVAVDEYGGVAGTVTLTQVLEPLVGPLTREGFEAAKAYVPLNDATVEFNGDLPVDDANEHLGLELPRGDYVTMAGMILAHLGRIPDSGETMTIGKVSIRVVGMDGRRIARVRLQRL
ncbi:MAG: HlyC/CorC family transporter, partial [SAR202 cluster bacterium]|nr:HlyC/CorC family transporter [SAR202 cluster bacterium]